CGAPSLDPNHLKCSFESNYREVSSNLEEKRSFHRFISSRVTDRCHKVWLVAYRHDTTGTFEAGVDEKTADLSAVMTGLPNSVTRHLGVPPFTRLQLAVYQPLPSLPLFLHGG
ncbi:mCG144628, partial [Mus musculus]